MKINTLSINDFQQFTASNKGRVWFFKKTSLSHVVAGVGKTANLACPNTQKQQPRNESRGISRSPLPQRGDFIVVSESIKSIQPKSCSCDFSRNIFEALRLQHKSMFGVPPNMDKYLKKFSKDL